MVQIDASFGVLRAGSKAFVRGIGTLYPEIRWPRSPIQVADHNLVSDIGSIAESVSESVRLPCAVVIEQHKSDATLSRIVGEGLVAVWALDCNRRRWRWKCIGAESEPLQIGRLRRDSRDVNRGALTYYHIPGLSRVPECVSLQLY